jgi:hypothetical protein
LEIDNQTAFALVVDDAILETGGRRHSTTSSGRRNEQSHSVEPKTRSHVTLHFDFGEPLHKVFAESGHLFLRYRIGSRHEAVRIDLQRVR